MHIIFLYAIVLSIYFYRGIAEENDNTASFRIVGGDKAFAKEFPWHISIRYFGFHVCGGTLVNEYTILTAAHCAHWFSTKYTIVGGEQFLTTDDGSEQNRTVASVINHPGYNSTSLENDIAIIKVSEPFIYNKFVQPARLSFVKTVYPQNLVAVGWGKTQENKEGVSNRLFKVEIPLTSEEACKKFMGSLRGPSFSDSVFCAGGVYDKGTCFGDSGSPVHAGTTVIGISSAAVRCGKEGIPSIYTNISFYSDWLSPRF